MTKYLTILHHSDANVSIQFEYEIDANGIVTAVKKLRGYGNKDAQHDTAARFLMQAAVENNGYSTLKMAVQKQIAKDAIFYKDLADMSLNGFAAQQQEWAAFETQPLRDWAQF